MGTLPKNACCVFAGLLKLLGLLASKVVCKNEKKGQRRDAVKLSDRQYPRSTQKLAGEGRVLDFRTAPLADEEQQENRGGKGDDLGGRHDRQE